MSAVAVVHAINELARFRADPSRVRVAIRPCRGKWSATVANRDGEIYGQSTSAKPRVAVFNALRAAERRELEGVDLGMQWAYDHPQFGGAR